MTLLKIWMFFDVGDECLREHFLVTTFVTNIQKYRISTNSDVTSIAAHNIDLVDLFDSDLTVQSVVEILVAEFLKNQFSTFK